MKYAQIAMDQMLVFYVVEISIMVVCIGFSLFGRKSNTTYPFGIALCLLLVFQTYHFVPFAREYANNEIVVQEGEYENSTIGRKNTPSRRIGLKGVTFKTEDEEIHLTTVPGYKDVFIEGNHYVRAYYLGESKILLYIEPL